MPLVVPQGGNIRRERADPLREKPRNARRRTYRATNSRYNVST